MTGRSPFLDVDPSEWTASNELAFCIRGDRTQVTRWLARARTQDDQLNDIARTARWERNTDRTLDIGRGEYLRPRNGIRLWVARDDFELVGHDVVRRVFVG